LKLTLESTTRMVEINGVPARIWEGQSESGIHVVAAITRVAVERSEDTSQFEAELEECRPPSVHGVMAFEPRMLLDG
jgi:hypothetical protein